jgi:glycosyltransferase involved in cell wall biosynthesis
MLESLNSEVRSRIEYLGFQPPDELPKFFGQADVFVLPSRYDGWGVVINQAVAAGLPVICSDQVGAGFDLVDEGVNGSKFSAGDEEGLFQAMRHFVDHPEILTPWGEASRLKARSWTPVIAAEKWANAMEEVIRG